MCIAGQPVTCGFKTTNITDTKVSDFKKTFKPASFFCDRKPSNNALVSISADCQLELLHGESYKWKWYRRSMILMRKTSLHACMLLVRGHDFCLVIDKDYCMSACVSQSGLCGLACFFLNCLSASPFLFLFPACSCLMQSIACCCCSVRPLRRLRYSSFRTLSCSNQSMKTLPSKAFRKNLLLKIYLTRPN